MRRFFLIEQNDAIAAEGVLFTSGLAAVSFLGANSGVMVWPSFQRAVAIHSGVGGRRLVWYDEDPDPSPYEEFLTTLYGIRDELSVHYPGSVIDEST